MAEILQRLVREWYIRCMTDAERDQLLLELRDRLVRVEATQADHGTILADHGTILADHGAKLDALSDQVQDVAQAVRELGGDVIDHPSEATG
ncbi:MAG: hypothetical protein OXP69_16375 [Spirochaetaceae bacterium]|nr:hypothetical protein [Spirochaetaceae bacterium]